MRGIIAIATCALIGPLLIRSEMTVPGQTADLERKNLEVIRRAIEAKNRHDLKEYLSYLAEESKNFDRPTSREAIQRAAEEIFTMFPDYKDEIIEMMAKDGSVVMRCKTSGTHRGVGKLPLWGGILVGVAPTQKHFEVQHIHWYKLRDGKIIEHTANRDDIGMMQQLGLLRVTGQPK
jgi:predicted ester cyclase